MSRLLQLRPDESTIRAQQRGGSTTTNTATGAFTDFSSGGWHHVTMTRSGSTLSLYIDGSFASSGSTSISGYDADTLSIGRYDAIGSIDASRWPVSIGNTS